MTLTRVLSAAKRPTAVHLSEDVVAVDGGLRGQTLCHRPVGVMLLGGGYGLPDPRYQGNDHRPVTCERCIDQAEYEIRVIQGRLDGEPDGWWLPK